MFTLYLIKVYCNLHNVFILRYILHSKSGQKSIIVVNGKRKTSIRTSLWLLYSVWTYLLLTGNITIINNSIIFYTLFILAYIASIESVLTIDNDKTITISYYLGNSIVMAKYKKIIMKNIVCESRIMSNKKKSTAVLVFYETINPNDIFSKDHNENMQITKFITTINEYIKLRELLKEINIPVILRKVRKI